MPDSDDESDSEMSVNILTDSKPKAKPKSILKKKGKKQMFLKKKKNIKKDFSGFRTMVSLSLTWQPKSLKKILKKVLLKKNEEHP